MSIYNYCFKKKEISVHIKMLNDLQTGENLILARGWKDRSVVGLCALNGAAMSEVKRNCE